MGKTYLLLAFVESVRDEILAELRDDDIRAQFLRWWGWAGSTLAHTAKGT